MKNNEKFINSFSTLAQLANQQMGNFDAATMANQMEVFNNRMDELMINNKMVTELMDTQQPQTDATVEEMKLALQQEIAMEQQSLLHEQEQANYMKQKAESDKFLDELNGL
jgi:acetyl-CoA carboxylase alpha subunit